MDATQLAWIQSFFLFCWPGYPTKVIDPSLFYSFIARRRKVWIHACPKFSGIWIGLTESFSFYCNCYIKCASFLSLNEPFLSSCHPSFLAVIFHFLLSYLSSFSSSSSSFFLFFIFFSFYCPSSSSSFFFLFFTDFFSSCQFSFVVSFLLFSFLHSFLPAYLIFSLFPSPFGSLLPTLFLSFPSSFLPSFSLSFLLSFFIISHLLITQPLLPLPPLFLPFFQPLSLFHTFSPSDSPIPFSSFLLSFVPSFFLFSLLICLFFLFFFFFFFCQLPLPFLPSFLPTCFTSTFILNFLLISFPYTNLSSFLLSLSYRLPFFFFSSSPLLIYLTSLLFCFWNCLSICSFLSFL